MDKAKTSQDRRNRDRKPDDPWPHQLLRSEGQDPSKSRNSERMEQYRGGRKEKKGSGRRGRKSYKQGRKVNKQRRVNTCERNAELQERLPLIKKVRWKIRKIADRCEQGLVVTKHKFETKAHSPHMFCAEGLVVKQSCINIWRPLTHGKRMTVVVERVRSWDELSSRFLISVLKRLWSPYEPKGLLEILAEL